ncbi:MAG: NAD(+)/NADH kinase [Planctomycetes bacterium]|nr:NAD(+)/NADH kinase [Planctomycetota bacterium]
MTAQRSKPGIFLLGNAGKPHVAAAFDRMSKWLNERGLLAGSDLANKPEKLNLAAPDYVIAMGGDGTILHAAQAMQQRQVPIIGVNMGKLGYLADFDENEIYNSLDDIIGNEALISHRMVLDVRVVSPDGETWSGMSLNDCVIRVGDPYRTINLEVSIDDQPSLHHRRRRRHSCNAHRLHRTQHVLRRTHRRTKCRSHDYDPALSTLFYPAAGCRVGRIEYLHSCIAAE